MNITIRFIFSRSYRINIIYYHLRNISSILISQCNFYRELHHVKNTWTLLVTSRVVVVSKYVLQLKRNCILPFCHKKVHLRHFLCVRLRNLLRLLVGVFVVHHREVVPRPPLDLYCWIARNVLVPRDNKNNIYGSVVKI